MINSARNKTLAECRSLSMSIEVYTSRLDLDMNLPDNLLLFTALNCVTDYVNDSHLQRKKYFTDAIIRDNLTDSITANKALTDIEMSNKKMLDILNRLRGIATKMSSPVTVPPINLDINLNLNGIEPKKVESVPVPSTDKVVDKVVPSTDKVVDKVVPSTDKVVPPVDDCGALCCSPENHPA